MPVKAIFFDFMGTCLDWHTGVLTSLPPSIPSSTASQFALAWRQAYFDSNASRLARNVPPEDIDITLRETLLAMLERAEYVQYRPLFTEEVLKRCVDQWHSMPAWPDVPTVIDSLRATGKYELFVFANGTPRLQLDLCRSSGLRFDMLFSSALLGVYKPARESYEKVLEMVKVTPEESVMAAAHAYDLRGAKEVGMRTVYVERWTDDVREDKEGVVRGEVDVYLDGGMKRLVGVIESLGQ